MPWQSSYVSPEQDVVLDAREHFRKLAANAVPEPIASRIVTTRGDDGKIRHLVIDRAVLPEIGDFVVYEGQSGLVVRRFDGGCRSDRVWGKVTWMLKQV